jgi:hypothetical protein
MVKIEINFPCDIEPSDEWYRRLDTLMTELTDEYELEHPGRIMWVSGYGDKILWREPEEPEFDKSIYEITITEREGYPKELQRRESWRRALLTDMYQFMV